MNRAMKPAAGVVNAIGVLDWPGATSPTSVPSSNMMWCTLVSLFVQTIKSPTAAWIGFGSKALRPNVPTIRMITDIGVGGGTGVGGVVGSGIGAGVVGSS